MGIKFKALVVFALTLSASSIVDAALIQVDYKYTLTSNFGGFPAPKTFEVQSLYDLGDVVFTGSNQNVYGFVSGSILVDGTTYVATGGRLTYQDQVPFPIPTDRVTAVLNFGFDFDGVFLQNVAASLEGPESIYSYSDIPFIPDPSDYTLVSIGAAVYQFEGGNFANQANLESISFSAVPVPGAVWLFGSGLLGLFAVTKHKIFNKKIT